MKNLYAYTEPGPQYPGYVSINVDDAGQPSITVRAPGNNGNTIACLNLPPDAVRSMAHGILAQLDKPPAKATVFSRPECIFNYCCSPNPEVDCGKACTNPSRSR